MKPLNPISEELIAPCGMNCAICSRYLSYLNNLKRSQCVGCRPRNKRCEYLFKKCTGINHTAKAMPPFVSNATSIPAPKSTVLTTDTEKIII